MPSAIDFCVVSLCGVFVRCSWVDFVPFSCRVFMLRFNLLLTCLIEVGGAEDEGQEPAEKHVQDTQQPGPNTCACSLRDGTR